MLVQTNSYFVPKGKRPEHARLMRRFRHVLQRLGCDQFEVCEQVGANWGLLRQGGRFVQIMRFRDRHHHQQVQEAERKDAAAQDLIREFCELIDFDYQKERNLFAVGYYADVLPSATDAPAATEAPESLSGDAALDQIGVGTADAAPAGPSRDFVTADADEQAEQKALGELNERPGTQPPKPEDAGQQ